MVKNLFEALYQFGRIHSRPVRAFYRNLKSASFYLLVKVRYQFRICALRKAVRTRKLRVIFVIGEPAKWKCQSIYDAMKSSDLFDPFVAPTMVDLTFSRLEFQRRHLSECREFFAHKGVQMVDVVSADGKEIYPLSIVKPDIVIYQQPWGVSENQGPLSVSRYALTFYIPYYIPANVAPYAQAISDFHRALYGNCVENAVWIRELKRLLPWHYISSRMIPIGSPMREELAGWADRVKKENLVIYAPHWSFPCEAHCKYSTFSTFLQNGQKILSFAQKHPEIRWVFKPHPVLKDSLIATGTWTEKQVEDYWDRWRAIGAIYETGDYSELFYRSKAMITDCLSFLTEYLIVNRPLIRLEPKQEPEVWIGPARRKFDAMYRVRTPQDLDEVLETVIVNDVDDLKDVRGRIIHELGLDENAVSQQLIAELTKTLC